ncbi:MAG: hypothetical protein WAM79_03890 [Candidatus Sulfotelmatobacter sp.]
MEQSCYKCGQLVEEGRPFCPHCAAPQIRVLVPEPVAAAVPYAEADALPQSPRDLPASQTVPVLALPMSWSDALKPCALAALVATVLMGLGLHPFVAMLSVGFLAVVFYRQSRPGIAIKPAGGARLGAISGLLWFAMSAVLEATVVLFLHKGPEVQKGLRDVIEQAASRTSDPQAVAMFTWFKTAQGLQVLMICAIVFSFIAAIVLGAVGGALGGTIFGRRNKS